MSIKRIFDLSFSVIILILIGLPALLIWIIITIFDKGPLIYWSNRVGKNNIEFLMPKIRTMKVNTPNVASHLLQNPKNYFTTFGGFLRKYSIDELPQVWSIFQGKMSFVGPRPALYSQTDLISLRKLKGVDKVLPGITGWAQINGRDSISIVDKVLLDTEYLHKKSFFFDLTILWLTFFGVIFKKNISH